MFNGGGSSSSQQSQVPGATNADMTAILGNQRRRMELQDPLYEAVTRMAMGILPTKYQSGNTALTSRRENPVVTNPVTQTGGGGGSRTGIPLYPHEPWASPASLRERRENPEWRQG